MIARNLAGLRCKMALGFTLGLFLVLMAKPAEASPKDVGLYLNFAHGFKAAIAGGDGVPVKIIGHPRIVAGPHGGKAVELCNGRDALVYRLKGNLKPRQGTISIWLSPVNWDGSSGNALQVLMHTNGGPKAQQMVLQTFYPFGGLMMVLYNHGKLIGGFPTGIGCTAPLRMARDLASVLRPGQWYNYIITWRDGYDAIYLNGQRRGSVGDPGLLLRRVGNRLYIGWDKKRARVYWEPYTGVKARPLANKPWKSLLANVTVLKTFVLAEQAKKIYHLGAVRWAASAGTSELAIYPKFYQTAAALMVDVVMPGHGKRRGQIQVTNAAGKVVADQAFGLPAKQVQEKVMLHLSGLPVGRYFVRGATMGGVHTRAVAFNKVHPQWMGNKLGDKDVVLWPWTSIKLASTPKGPTVNVWGRSYSFFGGPLPASMVSRGQEILSQPVHWVLGKSTVAFGPAQVVRSGPARVVLRSVGKAGPYQVVARTRVDYDGFLWSSFAFTAPKKEKIGPLKVRVPINAKHCLFMQYDTRRNDAFPTRRWSRSFMPDLAYIFVGGNSAGLEWFAQSDQYWHNADPNKQMQVVPVVGGGGRIVMNVVGKQALMPAHFTISFGLMGTPVRPMPQGWRGWSNSPPDRWRQGVGRPWRNLQLDYSWWSISPAWLIPGPDHPPIPFQPGRYRAWCPFTSTDFFGVRAYAEKNPKKLMPLWKAFAPEWETVPGSGQIGGAPGWATDNINPAPSFVDYYIWQLNYFLAHYPAAGIYIDGAAGNMPSCNRMAGFGYDVGHGHIKPTYPILAARRMARRMDAVMLHDRGKNGIIWIHRSTCLLMPVQSFCNVTLDGEFMGWTDIMHNMVTHGIRAALTDDLLRCTFSNRMFGQVPMMDSRYVDWVLNNKLFPNGGVASVRVQNARMVMGLLMLNDIWGWGNIGGYSEIFMPAVDWWGIADKDVRFLPWWGPKPVASAGWASRVSVYWKPEQGKALVVALNNSNRWRGPGNVPGLFKIKLNLAALGLKKNGFKAYNAESRGTERIPVDGNVIPLKIGPYGVRLIALVRNK